MTKQPWFWVVLALGSAIGFWIAAFFGTRALPILDVQLSMSREAAEIAAVERVRRLDLAPAGARTAVRFASDEEVQNFVELEGGGTEAFKALMAGGAYAPMRWEVRFFRELDPAVTTVFFTPKGEAYGFARHVPDAEPGPALVSDAALDIARARAAADWGVELAPGASPYALAERSFEKRPNGRVDHVFVYERGDTRLDAAGEGRLRLRLVVAGDRLTQLEYGVKVPESFKRRFAQMRSANTTLAASGSMALLLLYGFGGLIGLVWLGRQRWLLARRAMGWAAVIAAAQAASMLNLIPASWFDYDTAISANTFLLQRIGLAVAVFVGNVFLFGATFITAESLTRKAFGSHPQFWRLWSRSAAATPQGLGRTVGGYMWVGYSLAFVVLFHYAASRWLGWWSPLQTLTDPNILATPLPWLPPVANSFQAGFWEECMFRALPLAGAALLGDFAHRRWNGRLGGRRAWLLIALVVQALIFGAGHATYPNQPAYARPVELFVPALVWGLVYLRFGLLPGIVCHFIYDLVLMSLPIFVANAPGLALDRAAVIVCGAVPLLVVLIARVRAGRWAELPQVLRNTAWMPDAAPTAAAPAVATVTPDAARWTGLRRWLPALGLAGLAAWALWTPFRQDAPSLEVGRAQAQSAADAALHARGVTLPGPWQRYIQPAAHRTEMADDFVWREGGAQAYAALTGAYLGPPVWRVRYVRFDGDVVERAEEWRVEIESGVDGRGGPGSAPHVRAVEHVLPEARPGKALSVDEARAIAERTVRERFGREPAQLREVSAEQHQRPQRRDWQFTYADPAGYPLASGEARLRVDIAGDEVVATRRLIHVPEAWERAERDRQAPMRMVQIGFGITTALAVLVIFGFAVAHGGRHGFGGRRMLGVAGAVFALGALVAANGWEEKAFALHTEQPLMSQLWLLGGGTLIQLLLAALFAGLLANAGIKAAAAGKLGGAARAALLRDGIALGLLIAGLGAAAAHWGSTKPVIESLGVLNPAWPWLGKVAGAASWPLNTLLLSTFLLVLLHDFSAGFTRRRGWTIAVLMIAGLMSQAGAPVLSEFLVKGVAAGALYALAYVFIVRHEPKLVLVAQITLAVLGQVQVAVVQPYPGAWMYALIDMAMVCAVSWWWLGALESARAPAGAGPVRSAPEPVLETR